MAHAGATFTARGINPTKSPRTPFSATIFPAVSMAVEARVRAACGVTRETPTPADERGRQMDEDRSGATMGRAYAVRMPCVCRAYAVRIPFTPSWHRRMRGAMLNTTISRC